MAIIQTMRELTSTQRKTVIASFLGWTLDAFDFFLLVFVVPEIAKEFNVEKKDVFASTLLTLAFRPLGALLFGWLADKFGRRPILMIDIVLFAVFEFASAFAPSLLALLIIRSIFGIAMGGEWGIGASLTMESIPPKARGAISGLLQEGYASGYLLCAIVYWLLFDHIGWRGMFMIGAAPALLVIFIRQHVPESPVWEEQRAAARKISIKEAMKGHWPRFAYLVVLMTCFNMFSHGSQDAYPTFLKTQLKFDTAMVSKLSIALNVGAICGGLMFGAWSEKIGRRRAIIIAALCALPAIPLWAFGANPLLLGLGVFLLQFCVQGAWGIVPVHLNELSPESLRGTLPGFAYQGGNLAASWVGIFLATLAEWRASAISPGVEAAQRVPQYAFAMASVIAVVAVLLALVTWLGPEAKGARFGSAAALPEASPAGPAA